MNTLGTGTSEQTPVANRHIFRALILVGFLVIALVGFSTPKQVSIRIDEKLYVTHTSKAYVGQLLTEYIDPQTEMRINYDKGEALVDEMEIIIATPKLLEIEIGETKQTVTTSALQVKDFLLEQELTAPKGYTLVNTEPEAYLSNQMTLNFDYTTYEEEVISETTDPIIEYVEDDTLVEGEESIIQIGEATVIERTYAVRTVNEEIVERTLTQEIVTTPGQATIIALGTKVEEPEPVVATVKNEVAIVEPETEVVNTITMKMTFYGCQSCGSASGIPVDSDTKMYQGMRILSADWSILPAGSIVNVPGWGQSIVLDTGVSGNHIDMFIGKDPVPSHGVEHPTIEVIRLGW
ncbi:MAG: G5 domain-containing protein, partial [Culicoidibacterales bacterium]